MSLSYDELSEYDPIMHGVVTELAKWRCSSMDQERGVMVMEALPPPRAEMVSMVPRTITLDLSHPCDAYEHGLARWRFKPHVIWSPTKWPRPRWLLPGLRG